MKNLLLVFSLIIIASCSSAQKASEVNASRVSIAPFLSMDCKGLATEQNALLREAEALGAQVDSEYSSDKGVEIAAWRLFAPAAFFLEGNAESSAKLSTLKGQLEAVQEAQKINECTS